MFIDTGLYRGLFLFCICRLPFEYKHETLWFLVITWDLQISFVVMHEIQGPIPYKVTEVIGSRDTLLL